MEAPHRTDELQWAIRLDREQDPAHLQKWAGEQMEIVIIGAAMIGSVFASLALAKVVLAGVFAAITKNQH